jgi:antirestriction protein
VTNDPTPQIYVVSLADYNAGRLHGQWIDASQQLGGILADVAALLAASREPHAEEWAIFDYDNFGPLRLGEHEDLARMAAIAAGIAEHGVAFACWAEFLGRERWDELERCDDCYLGHWSSHTAWASDLLEAMSVDLDAIGPEFLRSYIWVDLARFPRDASADYGIVQVRRRHLCVR